MTAEDAEPALERAWRDEWGRLTALLVAQYRRLDLAEDGLADAFEAAARTWPRTAYRQPAGVAADQRAPARSSTGSGRRRSRRSDSMPWRCRPISRRRHSG